MLKRIIKISLILLFLGGCATNKSLSIQQKNIVDVVSNTDKVAWGIGKEKDSQNQPVDCVKANLKYNGYNAIFVGAPQQKIYLTFDNGYENGNTAKILDVLMANNVHAVFFITGDYAANNAELINRMIREGHIIGNHSYNHPSFADCSSEKITTEIKKLEALMAEKYNYEMNLLRPPRGEFTELSLDVANSLGYQNVLWSFVYYDYNVDNQPSYDQALNKLVNGLHPGAIYLLHSISDTNTEVLDEFIKKTKEAGYTISDYDLN